MHIYATGPIDFSAIQRQLKGATLTKVVSHGGTGDVQVRNGQKYLQECSYIAKLSACARGKLLCEIVFKTIFTFGLCWISKTLRCDWDFYKSGRRTISVYHPKEDNNPLPVKFIPEKIKPVAVKALVDDNANQTKADAQPIPEKIKPVAVKVLLNEGVKKSLLNQLTYNGKCLQICDRAYLSDRDFMMRAVAVRGYVLAYADSEFRKDREFVMLALEHSSEALNFADETLRNDKEVVSKALKTDGKALRYASEALQDDDSIVLDAVSRTGLSLEYASDRLKNNKKIVMAAVKENGLALRYASDKLKSDKDVVSLAVAQASADIKYAGEALKNDDDIAALLLANATGKDDGMPTQEGDFYRYLSDQKKNDRPLAIAAVKLDKENFDFISDELKKDPVLRNLAGQPKLPDPLDHEPTDEEITHWIHAGAFNVNALAKFPPQILNNKRLILRYIKDIDPTAYKYASSDLKNDPEIVFEAVSRLGSCLVYVPHKFRGDKKVVLAAVKKTPLAIEYAQDSMRDDKEVIYTAITAGGPEILQWASEKLRQDIEFALIAVETAADNFRHTAQALRSDRDLVFSGIEDGFKLEYASKTLRGDKEVVLDAVQNCGTALRFASDALRDDRDVVLAAMKNNKEAFKFASFRLQSDPEVLKIANHQPPKNPPPDF